MARRSRLGMSVVGALFLLAPIAACSEDSVDEPAGPVTADGDYVHFEAGEHTVEFGGEEHRLVLPQAAQLRVTDAGIVPANFEDDDDLADVLPELPYQAPGGGEQFYFVMTDRFANGNPDNDDAGLGDDPLVSGFDPTNGGFFLGGDIAGITENLDYIEGLGATAIWLTPPFKNQPVQGGEGEESAGYHGYWITDFTQIDPHYGTNDELQELIDEAHARDIKIYFDIITNHTADVISYEGGDYSYIPTTVEPYTDAEGNVIDTYALAGQEFPELDPQTSFPYVPVASDVVKVPEWLNDVTLYHNRGDSTWAGESVTYGDFSGLDDLMTENKVVVDGMAEIYKAWIDMGIDGFRIDTAKHVNFEFWEDWTVQISEHADDEFFMFGEVFDSNPEILAKYPRQSQMDSVLDFAYQDSVLQYLNGADASVLSTLFAKDALYTTHSSSPVDLPTFLGNHDMGRVGYLLQGAEKEKKSKLAHALLYLTRGQPVIYYGDEQGFVGNGGDKIARQPLFETQVSAYQSQELIDGSEFGTGPHMATDSAMYETISELAWLRREQPGLSTGAQIELLSEGKTYAFSRVDPEDQIEYVVLVNSGDEEVTVDVTTLTEGGAYAKLYSTDDEADLPGRVSSANDNYEFTVPAYGAVVYMAEGNVTPAADDIALGGRLNDANQMELVADVEESRYSQTSFSYRVVGTEEWVPLGTSVGPDARIFHDLAGVENGNLLEYRAVINGNTGASMMYLVGGPAPELPEGAE